MFIILCINFSICSSKALCGSDHGVFINGNIGIILLTGMGAGDLGLQLMPDGVKTICIRRGELVLDFNGLAGIDELLKA